MPTECAGLARGRMMRLTRLDECGNVVEGLVSTLVTTGFILVTDTANYQDPEDITQPNANGDLCVDDQSDPALRWLDLEIQMCVIDPDAINLITGDPVVADDDTPVNTVGYRIDTALTGSANFALELWSGVPNQACAPGGFATYGYHLYPWIKQATWGERSVANGAYTITINARTQNGSPWGVGPYDIRRDAAVPATLEPLATAIGPTQPYHYELSDAPLPIPGCGAIELAIP